MTAVDDEKGVVDLHLVLQTGEQADDIRLGRLLVVQLVQLVDAVP